MNNRWLMKLKYIVALVLSFVMFISLTGCKKEDSPLIEQSMVVEDANDAITKLAEAEADYGYENALSELTEKGTTTIDGDCYYRLQQNFQGIPVYGRTVVCATDEEGNVTSTTGNVLDVDEDIDLEPTVTYKDIYSCIVEYATESLNLDGELLAIPQLSENNLVVYVGDNNIATLAYQLDILLGEEPYTVVIDAQSAQLYVVNSLMRTDYITIEYSLGPGEKTIDLNIDTDNDRYTLYDEVRNIELYSANNETLVVYYIFYDANDEILYYYYIDSGKWLNNKKEEINTPTGAYEYVKYGFTTREENQGVTRIFALSVTDFSEQTMGYLATVGDFFAERFGRIGYANDSLKYLPVVYNCSNGSYSMTNLGISMLSLKTGSGLNTAAHEFMHSVEASESAMQYSGESGAIMEALSDIFAEMVEYYYYERCDWLYDGGVRNLVNPSLSTEENTPHPSTYKGKNWYSGSGDHGGVHYNSTVISHAAYLMSENGGGLLDMENLAKLWYRAMLMMPSDCDFNDCRQIVELAATSMELTTAQIKCVSEAFDAVGITGYSDEDDSDATYKVGLNGALKVYGGDGELCSNYTLVMAQKKLINIGSGGVRITRYITSAEPYDLGGLSEGKYTFTITDSANTSNTLTFTVSVKEKYDSSSVEVFTNFGCTPVKGTVSEIKEVNGADTNVPVTNAVVKVYSHAQESVIETILMSETEGYFEVYLPIGNYSVAVEAEGYISSTTSFEVTTADAVYLEIELKKDSTQKLVSQINYYQSGETRKQFGFSYNDMGLVETCTADSQYSRYKYSFTYNDAGQLLQYRDLDTIYLINTYSEDGLLSSEKYWVYDDVYNTMKYEYDEMGKIIRKYNAAGGGDAYYTYNADGQVESVSSSSTFGDMKSTTVHTYSYNTNGQLVSETVETDWGYDKTSSTTEYSYEYYPFILAKSFNQGELVRTELIPNNLNLDGLVTLDIDGTAVFEMKNGYLVGIRGSNYSYEISYDAEYQTSNADQVLKQKRVVQLAIYYEGELYRTHSLHYNEKNQLISVDFSEADMEAKLTYTYDAAGRLLCSDCGDFWLYFDTDEYTYNEEGLLICKKTYWGGNVLPQSQYNYAYDAQGNCISKTYLVPNEDLGIMEVKTTYTYSDPKPGNKDVRDNPAPYVLAQQADGDYWIKILDSVGETVWEEYLGKNLTLTYDKGYVVSGIDLYGEYSIVLTYDE